MTSQGDLYKGSSGWTLLNKEEFQEEDVVWGCRMSSADDVGESSSSESESESTPSTKMIRRSNGRDSSADSSPKARNSSAPRTIPDKQVSHDNGDGSGARSSSWESDEEEDDDGDGEMMPPHEWIDRKHARDNSKNNQITSFSMCEGVGRTLKGSDMERVRNDVWTKLGFLG